jgi:S1-C subfamily serine protease
MTSVCPACQTRGPVRLRPGQVCASCDAQAAWQQLGDAPLVIDRGSIEAAVRRRAGEVAGQPLWRRCLIWALPAMTLVAAAAALWCTVDVLSPRPIGPIAALTTGLVVAARTAALVGLAAFVLGVVALVRLRRRHQFRRLGFLTCHLVAIVLGATAAVIGMLHWAAWQPTRDARQGMPPRAALGVTSHVDRILDATVVVLAPDAGGDARNLAMGTGAVVFRDPGTAWIVTCSHVAMPDVAVGTYHDVRTAPAVWVLLADGREGRATVRWVAAPPLDVALVELRIDNPPRPVEIAADTSGFGPDDSVTFVPNPYRAGWNVEHGKLVRRDTHHTTAGTYDLLITDLRVIPGDSGSGLYDVRGQLVGLNTWTGVEDGHARGISLPSEAMQQLVIAIRDGALDRLDQAVGTPPRR